jgi:AcrR family transcriptional regulator
MNGDHETRERLLRAGERLFAEHGFKRVTVRAICRAARANVASVNYHFGDKMGLYREAMQIAIDAIRDSTESARKAGEGRPPDEQLRRFITLWLHRLLAPGHHTVHQLIEREIADPTPALDDLVEQALRPRLEYLSGVIADIIGTAPSDPRVMRCVLSILSQPMLYARSNPIGERLGFSFKRTPAQIDAFAEHIADFSLAGVRAISRQPQATSH